VVVGFDYTYGKARGGTVETLRAACEARGAAFSVVPKVTVDGLPASSTKVRELLLDGKVAPASRLLDRHYALEGEVVRGAGRGKGLGFPTANLGTAQELIPGSGVYAVLARVGGRFWPAAANIGRKPTVAGADAPITVEVHLIGFEGDLYGQRMEALFLERIRSEQRFPGLDALVAQIARDVERAKGICAAARPLPLDPSF
jgi:riboflavin kinase/FMN adenylyltransferase